MIHILASSWREAARWAREHGDRPITDYNYLGTVEKLDGVPFDAEAIMLPGFFEHPDWEEISQWLHERNATVRIVTDKT